MIIDTVLERYWSELAKRNNVEAGISLKVMIAGFERR
jgi:hypothetical protein